MPKVESASSLKTADILTPLEREVLSKVGKQLRWYTVCGSSHYVYGLPMSSRANHIPKPFLDDSKVIEEFPIRVFDCHSTKALIHVSKHMFDRKFKEVNSTSGINLESDDGCEAFKIGRKGDKCKGVDISYITVNDRVGIVSGKKMILTNAGKKDVSPLPISKAFRFESRLGRKDIWLKPSESVLLEFEKETNSRVWKEIGKSISNKVSFDVNPIARQSGPVLRYIENGRSKGVDFKLDGELFLPLKVIERLLQSKVDVSHKPFIQWICTNSDLEIKAFLEATRNTVEARLKAEKKGMHACMVYEHLPVHHTLVVNLYVKKKDEVYCYFHETLGSENKLAKDIRNKLLEPVKSTFCDHSIICIFPKEAMQKDYSVCGVFAIKFIRYISKKTIHWTSFMEGQIKGQRDPEADLEIRPMPVATLPAELLKMCQDASLASREQENYPVGHKKFKNLTLKEYWAAYGGREKEDSNNHAALVKLYKYYHDYAALKKKMGKKKIEIVDCPQVFDSSADYKRKLRNYSNSLCQPDTKKAKSSRCPYGAKCMSDRRLPADTS